MATIPAPINQNYSAMVVQADTLHDLPGLDNLRALRMAGMQALVGKDVTAGTIGVLFPAEVQLSPDFCRHNNLYRHSHLNRDPATTGYLDDNGRLRAIKLRQHRSDALFLPLHCLAYLTNDAIPVGTQFDVIDGTEVCRKYVPPHRQPGAPGSRDRQPRKSRIVAFPRHFDTTNYHRIADTLDEHATVIVTQKLHGTSVRIGHIRAERKLSLAERILQRLGVRLSTTEHLFVAGSRNVDKTPVGDYKPTGQHYYGTDVWTEHAGRLSGMVPRIPRDVILYGEIIGWVGTKPIQSGYTYNLAPGQSALYIYRVAMLNADGTTFDLSDAAMREFCAHYGLTPVPHITTTLKWLFDRKLEAYLDVPLTDFIDGAVPLSPESPCDEGVCIRIEGMTPQIYKLKSPEFLQHETKTLDNPTPETIDEDDTDPGPDAE